MSRTDSGQVVTIPMNDWSLDRLDEGEKTATTRTSRNADPGDLFEAGGRHYQITHVLKVPLVIVAEHFWDLEGCENTAEFIDVWNDIHYRKGYDPNWEVWLHLFREVGDGGSD